MTFVIKDANGAIRTMQATVDGNGVTTPSNNSSIQLAGVNISNANLLPVDGSNVTQPISVVSLPLPAGAATAANQVTSQTYQANAATAALQNTQIALLTNASTSSLQTSGNTILSAIADSLDADTNSLGASFTRPTTANSYVSGQLVSNTHSAPSVTTMPIALARHTGTGGKIIGLSLSKSSTNLTNAQFRVHLFKNSPTSIVGDTGTFAGSVNGVASMCIGYFDITMDQMYTDGAKGFLSISEKAFTTISGSSSIYALIETRAAYVGIAGETFSLYLDVDRN